MPVRIFISYSRADSRWFKPDATGPHEFDLIPWLVNQLQSRAVCKEFHDTVEIWWDERLNEHTEAFKTVIRRKISEAHFAIILVSTEFLNSKFIDEDEFPLLKKRTDEGSLFLIPIYVAEPANTKDEKKEWLSTVQGLPIDPKTHHLTYLNLLTEPLYVWQGVRNAILDSILGRMREAKERRPDLFHATVALPELERKCTAPGDDMPDRGLQQMQQEQLVVREPAKAPRSVDMRWQNDTREDGEDKDPERMRPPYVDDNVQFTVYRPKRVQPQKWYHMLAFAHLSEKRKDASPDDPDPLEEVRRQAVKVLDNYEKYCPTGMDSQLGIPREGTITFMPEMAGFEFNPPCRSFLWQETVHQEGFRLRALPDMDGKTGRGRMTVFLGHIIVADISLSIPVDSQCKESPKQPALVENNAAPYRKVFASYSHNDVAIVRQLELYAQALGDRYLRDCVELRSGEPWGRRLMEMIQEAQIFQLFWSKNSMVSPYVEREWQYALSLGRQNFVRPVYWEHPLPAIPKQDLPPETLSRLHFQRIDVQAVGGDQRHNSEADSRHLDEAFDHFHAAPVVDATEIAQVGLLNKQSSRLGLAIAKGVSLIAVISFMLLFLMPKPQVTVSSLASPISHEAELDTSGGGVVRDRSEASAGRSLLLIQNQQTAWTAFLPQDGSYEMDVQYSNDGPTDLVGVMIDGQEAPSFDTKQTGTYGNGWNKFVTATCAIGPLPRGKREIILRAEKSDEKGVEIDMMKLRMVGDIPKK